MTQTQWNNRIERIKQRASAKARMDQVNYDQKLLRVCFERLGSPGRDFDRWLLTLITATAPDEKREIRNDDGTLKDPVTLTLDDLPRWLSKLSKKGGGPMALFTYINAIRMYMMDAYGLTKDETDAIVLNDMENIKRLHEEGYTIVECADCIAQVAGKTRIAEK
jgi:hypothetical protein